MTNHYIELEGDDAEYLMTSCPRVIAFEELVIEWGIKLLEKVGNDELFKRKTLEQDLAELERLGSSDND